MAVPMPTVAVIILCATTNAGGDDNSPYTHYQNRSWEITDGMMHCRRNEVQLYDPAEGMGADPRPFSPFECQRAAIMAASEWSAKHPNSKWSVWRVACPTPTIDLNTGEIIGWVLPDCGHRETVICEGDTAI